MTFDYFSGVCGDSDYPGIFVRLDDKEVMDFILKSINTTLSNTAQGKLISRAGLQVQIYHPLTSKGSGEGKNLTERQKLLILIYAIVSSLVK